MANREAFDAVMEEADGNMVLDNLAAKDGEITIDDLRTLPGASERTDEELTAAWEAAQSADYESPAGAPAATQAQDAAAVAAATGGEAVQTARGWKVYDDAGKEIADLSKMTAADFLKHKIGYNANGAEHRKSLDELTRVASYGHHNQQKIARVEAERNQFYERLQKVEGENTTRADREKLLNYAFTQFHIGNDKPLSQLLTAYKTQMGGLPGNEAAAAAPAASRNVEADGLRYFHESIVPRADAIATKYGAKADEVRTAIQQLIAREPMLTEQKINDIIEHEVPYLLEDAGYRAGGTTAAALTPRAPGAPTAPAAAAAPDASIAALQKQVAELKAAMGNRTAADIRARNASLPGAGGTTNSTAGNTLASPNSIPPEALKSAADFKRHLRNS